MKDETVELLMTKLEAVASKIGTTAEYMFGVFVTQAKVVVLTHSIVCVIFFLLLASALFMIFKVSKKDYWWDSSTDLTFPAGFTIALCVLALFSGIVALAGMSNLITCIWNPEFYALKELFKSIK
jgi:hypothetical protein